MEGLLLVILFVIAMIFVVVARIKLERKIAPYDRNRTPTYRASK
jgi:hypothetical protein